LAELDAGFAALWAAAPAGTLVVVVTGQGDTAYCRCVLNGNGKEGDEFVLTALWSLGCSGTPSMPACERLACICWDRTRRYLQEQKWRRQQQQQQQQQDGLLPWSPACEAHLAAWQSRVQSALCFAAVKGAAPQQDEQLAGQQQQQNGQAQQGGEQSAGGTPQG
jgi:hypothetical protein